MNDRYNKIAGNIIGVYLGLDNIPSYYVDNLELKDVILKISRQLLFEED